jgi:hypothetical protein
MYMRATVTTKALAAFRQYAADNRGWLIWLVCCYGIDRATTYVCLLNQWFGEANPVVLALWAGLGHAGTEMLTILLIVLVFFYIGAYGKQYLKDYVLPAFCIVYGVLMLGNVAAFSLGALGLLRYGRYIDITSIINYNLFVLILILAVLAVFFVIKGRTLRRSEA